jgi:SAM-dependent methyltransferase
MNARDTYALARNPAEQRRLEVQAAFWAADAAALFDASGVDEGDRVADLGCGSGHVAIELARRVGPRGRAHALDNDGRLLEAAGRAGWPPQLEPVHGDAFATPWPDALLDAVHARFVAAPCGRVDELLGEMLRVVRPGGLVMMQEPVAHSWRVPAGAAWPRLLALIRAGFAHGGGSFDAGLALPARMSRRLAHVHVRRVAHVIPAAHPYAALPLAFCDALQATWFAAGLVGASELQALRGQIEHALSAPGAHVTTFTLVQAWGRKRASPGSSTNRRSTSSRPAA